MGALETTAAPLLFFLNPDAVPAPGCLDAIREAPADWGAWQALVLQAGGERVNTRGNVVHFLGFGWAGGHDEPAASVGPEPVEVGFASGAALAVRRAAWDEVGGFEPAFFMYGEDLDVSLRLRLAGWRIGMRPGRAGRARATSSTRATTSGSTSSATAGGSCSAHIPAPLLALLAPALLLSELALLAIAGRGGWLGAKLRAHRRGAAQPPGRASATRAYPGDADDGQRSLRRRADRLAGFAVLGLRGPRSAAACAAGRLLAGGAMRDRQPAMRVLAITPELPYAPGGSGGSTRQFHLLRRLRARGHDVTVVAPVHHTQREGAARLVDAEIRLAGLQRPPSRVRETLGALARAPR